MSSHRVIIGIVRSWIVTVWPQETLLSENSKNNEIERMSNHLVMNGILENNKFCIFILPWLINLLDITVGIWNTDKSGFWMVEKRLVCKWPGFWMGSEIWTNGPFGQKPNEIWTKTYGFGTVRVSNGWDCHYPMQGKQGHWTSSCCSLMITLNYHAFMLTLRTE